jgi:hypothetical protein
MVLRSKPEKKEEKEKTRAELMRAALHCHLGARRLHNVRVFTYPESGHFLHLENGAGFAGDLAAFLRQPGPSAKLRQPRSSGLPGLHDVPSRIADAVALRARRAMHAWYSPSAEGSNAS